MDTQEDAVDLLISAFSPYSCLAVPRRGDNSLVFTISDPARSLTITKVIPLGELHCKSGIATVIKDLQRDLQSNGGNLDNACLTDLRLRGARVRSYR